MERFEVPEEIKATRLGFFRDERMNESRLFHSDNSGIWEFPDNKIPPDKRYCMFDLTTLMAEIEWDVFDELEYKLAVRSVQNQSPPPTPDTKTDDERMHAIITAIHPEQHTIRQTQDMDGDVFVYISDVIYLMLEADKQARQAEREKIQIINTGNGRLIPYEAYCSDLETAFAKGEQKGREDVLNASSCPNWAVTYLDKIAQLEQQLSLYKKEFGELPISAIFDMPKIIQNECDIVKSYELGNMKEKDKVIYRAGGARGREKINELEQQLKEAKDKNELLERAVNTECETAHTVAAQQTDRANKLEEQLKTAKQEAVFINHIASHRKELMVAEGMPIEDWVMCKICDKTVAQIYKEEGKSYDEQIKQLTDLKGAYEQETYDAIETMKELQADKERLEKEKAELVKAKQIAITDKQTKAMLELMREQIASLEKQLDFFKKEHWKLHEYAPTLEAKNKWLVEALMLERKLVAVETAPNGRNNTPFSDEVDRIAKKALEHDTEGKP
jgi:myosin heavy subunit